MSNIEKNLLKIQSKLSQGRTTIGIDVGTSSVNIAQMAQYKGRPTLIKTAIADIRLSEGGDREYATLQALKEALSNFNTKRAKFACVVNCSQTSIRKIIIPYMPKQEMKSAVTLEIKRSIPFSIEEAVIDFNVIEEVMDKGIGKLSVIAAATPKETIEKLLSFFIVKKSKPFAGSISKKFEGQKKIEPLGLKLSALLPLSLCIENIVEKSNLKVSETLVTLEMGTYFTELNIFKDSRLEFSRKLPFSGNDITKVLTEALMTEKGKVELTVDEAEQVKRKYGIPKIEENQTINDKITTNHILSLIRPKVEQLANEIERSFDFYREDMHGGKVDRVVLFGGGAQLKGLSEFLSKELGLEVTSANPLEDIDLLCDEIVENEMDAHKLVLAIGASLSGMRGINLLPAQKKEKPNLVLQKVPLLAGSLSLAAVLLVSFVALKIRTASMDKKYKIIREEFIKLVPQLQQIKERKSVDQLQAGKLSWGEALKELSHVVPGNMQLTDIGLRNDYLNFKGVVDMGKTPSETLISQFMLNLENGIFNSVHLVKIEKSTGDLSRLQFEIKCRID